MHPLPFPANIPGLVPGPARPMKILLAASALVFFSVACSAVAHADPRSPVHAAPRAVTSSAHAAVLMAAPLRCEAPVVSALGTRVSYCVVAPAARAK